MELVLDLRRWHGRLERPADLLELWARIGTQLDGEYLRTGALKDVALQPGGVVGVLVAAANVVVRPDTACTIHGVIEQPRPARGCRMCAETTASSAGEFTCHACRVLGDSWGVCARHVVVLDGAYVRGGLVTSSCQQHAPQCKGCASPAVFWCHGPNCRTRQAWCDRHARRHANSPDIRYCDTCFDLVFPACSVRACREPGVNVCEHVEPESGAVCGRKLCNRHVARWQVYGYERAGLGRCDSHRAITRLDDQNVVWQVVAGTAQRRLAPIGNSERYNLPTLGSVKNILIQGRDRRYDEIQAWHLYQTLERRVRETAAGQPLQTKMLELLERAGPANRTAIEAVSARRSQGQLYFEKLQAVLRTRGDAAMASAITISDFIPAYVKQPPTPALFVRVPPEFQARFIGKKGLNIRRDGELIGCVLRIEREEQG